MMTLCVSTACVVVRSVCADDSDSSSVCDLHAWLHRVTQSQGHSAGSGGKYSLFCILFIIFFIMLFN